MNPGEAASTLSIVIADDQPMRAGFRRLLDGEDGMQVLGDAADG